MFFFSKLIFLFLYLLKGSRQDVNLARNKYAYQFSTERGAWLACDDEISKEVHLINLC